MFEYISIILKRWCSRLPKVASQQEEMKAYMDQLKKVEDDSSEVNRQSTVYLATLDDRLKDNWFRCIPECKLSKEKENGV